MFMGEYRCSIDEKGRLIIPSKMRNELGSVCVVTRGLDGCLAVYHEQVWNSIMEKYKTLPNTKDVRNYIRFYLSGAIAVEFDKQGRINISQVLIDYAQLKKECVIVGVAEKIEIWDKQKWNEYMQANEDKFSELADSIFSSGLSI